MYVNTRLDCAAHRKIIESTLLAIYDIPDADAKNTSNVETVFLNPEAHEIFPTIAEHAGKSFEDVLFAMMHPSDRESVRTVFASARASRNAYGAECRLLNTKTAAECWVMIRGYFLYSEHGYSFRHCGVIIDINEIRQREELAKWRLSRYRQIVNSTLDYVYNVRVENGKVTQTIHGDGCRKLTGYEPEDFARNENLWLEMVYETDRPKVLARAHNMLKNHGAPIESLEHRVVQRGGNVIWVSSRIVAEYNERGEVTAYSGVICDITDKRRIDELNCQRQYFSEVFAKFTPLAAALIVEDGSVIEVNDSGRRLGFAVDESAIAVLQKNVPEGNFDFAKIITTVIKSGAERKFDLQFANHRYDVTLVPIPPDLCLLCFYDLSSPRRS